MLYPVFSCLENVVEKKIIINGPELQFCNLLTITTGVVFRFAFANRINASG